MSPAKRIMLNVAATYGRSLYALVVGLFAGRWLLMALGETDYGLYGLVGGLAAFISFFNDLLSSAVERFFAFAVGGGREASRRPSVAPSPDFEDCQRWFSVALLMHVALALVLTALGYPLGVWAIENYLNIPQDRVSDCVIVFRFVCINWFVCMATVPCSAMYKAKQEIAELTVYNVISTTANVLVLGYMVKHPGVWLVTYGAWWCAIMTIPQFAFAVRSFVAFPECRFRFAFAVDRERMRKLVGFAGSRCLCALGQLLSGQGLSIVVNKYLGVARNAALTVSTGVSTHVFALSNALSGAFQPAITNAAGAGDFKTMRTYAYRICALSTMALLVIVLPLSLELDEVLRLWLGHPPEGSATICLCVLVAAVFERLSEGHWMAIFACGDIRRFQRAESLAYAGSFFLGWGLVALGLDLTGVGFAFLVGRLGAMLVKLRYGKTIAGLSLRTWLHRVMMPILLLTGSVFVVGALPRFLMEPSCGRVALTVVVCLTAFVPMTWIAVMSPDDRRMVLDHVGKSKFMSGLSMGDRK